MEIVSAVLDPFTGQRAVVLFGLASAAAASLVPANLRALVAGDAGTDQFISSYLWYR